MPPYNVAEARALALWARWSTELTELISPSSTFCLHCQLPLVRYVDLRWMPHDRPVLWHRRLWRSVVNYSQVTEFSAESPHERTRPIRKARPPKPLLMERPAYFDPTGRWHVQNLTVSAHLCMLQFQVSCFKSVGPWLLLPQSMGFQCTSPDSSWNKDSSPCHIASPQTSSCVVIRGSCGQS